MGIFINHNSFLILIVILWVAAAFALKRRRLGKRSALIMAGVTVLLITVYVLFSPSSNSGQQAAEIHAQIGQGTPVLLELKSQN